MLTCMAVTSADAFNWVLSDCSMPTKEVSYHILCGMTGKPHQSTAACTVLQRIEDSMAPKIMSTQILGAITWQEIVEKATMPPALVQELC